jgi:hypothetical protein
MPPSSIDGAALAGSVAVPRRASRLPIIAFAALSLLTLAPVLLARLPPLDDYINHLARMHVIALHGRDPLLDGFYGIHWKVVPNLAMDVIVPPLAHVTDVYFAGKLFVIAYMLLLLSGPHAIHYALFRRLSLAPLVAMLFVYNRVNGMGNVNYLFGVGLALWGIAAWIALSEGRPLRRAGVSAVIVLVLFFCHLEAVGIYGVTVLGYEAWRVWRCRADGRQMLARALAFGAPFVPVLPLWLLGPVSDAPTPPMHWELPAKLYGLWYVVKDYQGRLDLAVAAALAGGALLLIRRGWLRIHPAGWPFLALAAPVYLALPVEMMSGWGVDMRFPVAVLFALVGFLDWRLPTRSAELSALGALAALVVIRTAGVEAAWQRFGAVERDFRRSLEELAPGSKVLVATAREREEPAWLMPIHFLPCLVIIERSSLCSIAFAHPLQQVLYVKEPHHAIAGGYNDDPIPLSELLVTPQRSTASPSGRIYWTDWPSHYDYVYLISVTEHANPAPDRLDLLYDGDRLQLYRVKRPS